MPRPHATHGMRIPANVPNRENVCIRVGMAGAQAGESRRGFGGFYLTLAEAEELLAELRAAIGQAQLAELKKQNTQPRS